ncbi:g2522 [Coccomyxa elongata]
MGAGYGKEGEDEGIITVSSQRRHERLHPILMQLKELQQVPPILQEGKDPAWKGLQQDLQLMNVKHTDLDAEAILRLLEKYKAWCKAQALATLQHQEKVAASMDEVHTTSNNVLADVTRCAASTTTIAKQAGLVEDLVCTLADLERRVKACRQTVQELQVEALAIKLTSKR